jgi:hypothetical protein
MRKSDFGCAHTLDGNLILTTQSDYFTVPLDFKENLCRAYGLM